MSTQSETIFEWSVKLLCTASIRVGIASQLRLDAGEIFNYDETAILYSSFNKLGIMAGSKRIHTHQAKPKLGDVIRFRFQPRTKKLCIHSVRVS